LGNRDCPRQRSMNLSLLVRQYTVFRQQPVLGLWT
jgi:hypothetical protein